MRTSQEHIFMVQSEQVRGEPKAYWVMCINFSCRKHCSVLDNLEVDNDFVGTKAVKRVEALLERLENEQLEDLK